MIADKVLGNIHTDDFEGQQITVPFKWFETEKKRIAKVAADGTQFGICIGDTITDGDILGITDGKIYVAEITESKLIKINVSTMAEMGRLGFELGNRHLSLKIDEDSVTIPYDEPTYLYLKKIGFDAGEITGSFTDFIVCHAHDAVPQGQEHDHPHDHPHPHGPHGHPHPHGDHPHPHPHGHHHLHPHHHDHE